MTDPQWSGPDAPPERRIASILSRLDRQRRIQEGRMQLGAADLRLLWLFTDGRPRTLKEIAAELRLEQSTVNRQVNAALGSGFVVRQRRQGEAAYEFERTEDGRRIFEEDAGRTLGVYATALDRMGPERAEVFLSLAEDFLGNYRRELDGPTN